MKTPPKAPSSFTLSLTLLCSGLLALVAASSTYAIPNSVGGGGGGFVRHAGMRFEDFAANKNVWQADAKLAGKWENWNDDSVKDNSIEVLRLSLPAVVFGIAAEEVTVQRRDNQILRFAVTFVQPKGAKTPPIEARLRSNIAAWADSGSDSPYTSGGSTIHVSKADREGRVVVTFTSATAKAVTAS